MGVAAGRGPGEEVDRVMSKGGVAEIYMRYFMLHVGGVVCVSGGRGGGGDLSGPVEHSPLVKGWLHVTS